MDSENRNIFKCNVCEQSFDSSRALAIHTSAKYTHDGLQRNELNEIVLTCNYCNKTFRSQKSLYNHRRIKKNIRLMMWLSQEKQEKKHLNKHKTSTEAMDKFEMRYHTRKNA